MNLPIAKYGDPILRAPGRRVEKVNDHIRELAANMVESMHAANGVGLAAQQVGEALQLTVLDVLQTEDRPSTLRLNGQEIELLAAMPLILVNPKIMLDDETNITAEGCLSFPEITAEIERSVAVKVRAETLEGEPIEIEATGLLARALQHEVDHLNGILFIDRMSSVAKATLQSRLKRLRKETLRGDKNTARASQINL
jgi:peptide deformylase